MRFRKASYDPTPIYATCILLLVLILAPIFGKEVVVKILHILFALCVVGAIISILNFICDILREHTNIFSYMSTVVKKIKSVLFVGLINHYALFQRINVFKFLRLRNVDISKANIPEDREFFKDFKSTYCSNITLPVLDFNKYNLKNIEFSDITIVGKTDTATFNSLINLWFVEDKLHSSIKLPNADYSICDFKGINLRDTAFCRESILPEDVNFFQNISNKNASRTILTENCIRHIHLYNLNGVYINLAKCDWYKEVLTDEQLCILKHKYGNQINRNITLPCK